METVINFLVGIIAWFAISFVLVAVWALVVEMWRRIG